MNWAIRIYSFILLGYTGWRTWDFMNSQLPKNDLSFWLSTIFLFAAEVGLLAWDELYNSHVTTSTQEQVSNWMTWLDFGASTLAGLADMMMRQTMIEYAIPYWLAQALIYGMPAVMAVNIATVIIYRRNDAEKQIERKKRAVEFKIQAEALKMLDTNARAIARDKRTQIYTDLRDEITGKIDSEHKTQLTQQEKDQLNAATDRGSHTVLDTFREMFIKPPQSNGKVYNASSPATDRATGEIGPILADQPAPILQEQANGVKADPTRGRKA